MTKSEEFKFGLPRHGKFLLVFGHVPFDEIVADADRGWLDAADAVADDD